MEIDSGENSKITHAGESSRKEIGDFDVSPLGKSRYGRTRKPKITEDFYDIDLIFENKKSPQVNAPVTKRTQAVCKPRQTSSIRVDFLHVTGDADIKQSVSEDKKVTEASPVLKQRKFFKKDPAVTPTVTVSSSNAVAESCEPKETIDVSAQGVLDSIETVDVTKVLKIISSKPQHDDGMQNDLKAGSKQVLKTYGNKRKSFHKPAVVESFGLPDTPIFPIDEEKSSTNEPKRIKSLDLATSTSANNVNIVDKQLLDAPWKISSEKDFAENKDYLCENLIDKLHLAVLNTNQNKTETNGDIKCLYKGNDLSNKKVNATLDKYDYEKPLNKTKINENNLIQTICKTKSSLHDDKPFNITSTNKNITTNKAAAVLNHTETNVSKSKNDFLDYKTLNKTSAIKNTSTNKAKEPKTVPGSLSSHTEIDENKSIPTINKTNNDLHVDKTVNETKTNKGTRSISNTDKEPETAAVSLSSRTETNENKLIPTINKTNTNKSTQSITNKDKQPETAAASLSSRIETSENNLIPIVTKTNKDLQDGKTLCKTNTNNGTSSISKKIKETKTAVVSLSSDTETSLIPTVNKTNHDLHDYKTFNKTNANKSTPSIKAKEPETAAFSLSSRTETFENKLIPTVNKTNHDGKTLNITNRNKSISNKAKKPKTAVLRHLDTDDINKPPSEIQKYQSPHLTKKNIPKNQISCVAMGDESGKQDLEEIGSPNTLRKTRLTRKQLPVTRVVSKIISDEPKGEEVQISTSVRNVKIKSKKSPRKPTQVVANTNNEISVKTSKEEIINRRETRNKLMHSGDKYSPTKAKQKHNSHEPVSEEKFLNREIQIICEKLPNFVMRRSNKQSNNEANTVKRRSSPRKQTQSAEGEFLNKTPEPSSRVLRSLSAPSPKLSPYIQEGTRKSMDLRNKRRPSSLVRTSARLAANHKNEVECLDETDDLDYINLAERKRLWSALDVSKCKDEFLVKSPAKRGRPRLVRKKEEFDVKEEVVSEDEVSFKEAAESSQDSEEELSMEMTLKEHEVKQEMDNSNGVAIKTECSPFEVGDLMWAKVGAHPYWPCIISNDPFTHNHQKNDTRNRNYPCYHVRFFGDNGRRSWVRLKFLFPYTGKNDLTLIYKQLKRSTASPLDLQYYIIKEAAFPRWKIAVAEADSLKSSTVQERFDFFFNMFASAKEKKRRALELIRKEDDQVSTIKFEKETKRKSLKPIPVSSPEKKKHVRPPKTPKPNPVAKNTSSKSSPPPPIDKPKLQSNDVHGGRKTPKKELGKNATPLTNKARSKSTGNSTDDLSEAYFKNPWQAFPVPKRRLTTPLNEAVSEYSLSDTDSVSKSSSNTVEATVYKEQIARQREHYLFRGISRRQVCQVCRKPGDILKCKGPCKGIFHQKCVGGGYVDGSSILIKDESSENILLNSNKVSVSLNEVNKKIDTDNVSEIKSDVKIDNNDLSNVDVEDPDAETKNRLTTPPNANFSKLSLAEQIDLKMKEIMEKFERNTRYADSTTDYTSSEESTSNVASSLDTLKNVKKKKSLKHAATINSFHGDNSSSEDIFYGESSSNGQDVTSSKNNSIIDKKMSKERNKKEKVVGARDVCLNDEVSNDGRSVKAFKCSYCIKDADPPCYVCNKEISSKNVSLRQKCSLGMCGKFYHAECLKMWPQTQWSLIWATKRKNSTERLDSFVCPTHVCHTCASDNPHAAMSRCTSSKVVKCLRCPATYHTTNYCVPAGTVILSTSQIVCPRHLEQTKFKPGTPKTINTPWCFICSNGGDLICCETCPTSVHTDCLQINLLEDGTFSCDDCETGRFPLYDEVVWVKLGAYRWWPAVILFPNEVPHNVQKMTHSKGDFVVKFFGTHDHYWANRGRVFLFQEGDKGHCSPVKNEVDALFKKSIEEAAAAYQSQKVFKSDQVAEIKTGLKPPPYVRIKVNKPVGNVRVFDGNISNTTPCDCDPNQPNPCGPDSVCLNRVLLTECDGNVCPAKERCNNQRFEKRLYPPMTPFRTPSRGWGLKTLAPIRKGDFVIEYVGEVIDDQEYQRRIIKMHQQKDENYYFLTIDKDRIIDAGPRGNFARFMNHCCHPNCETQKWTVNGNTRVGLFAVVDIPANCELTFNYNLECVGKEKKICICGAPNCSGFIGVKVKMDESQKKPKKNNSFKKKKNMTLEIKTEGPCFVCGKNGDVGACCNKICTKVFHLQCVNLGSWPEGKWVCPWHTCTICSKRTIRCCVKCLNSYCPGHAEGNVRHDKLLGFICSDHDPTKEAHELVNTSLTSLTSPIQLTTKETDITSTTPDEVEPNQPLDIAENLDNDVILPESVTSTPFKSESISHMVNPLSALQTSCDQSVDIPTVSRLKYKRLVSHGKRKRGKSKQNSGNLAKKIKLSRERRTTSNQSLLADVVAQTEVKLTTSIPSRHLRTTRNNVAVKRFLNRQNELEKDLPIRKRSRPRCEGNS